MSQGALGECHVIPNTALHFIASNVIPMDNFVDVPQSQSPRKSDPAAKWCGSLIQIIGYTALLPKIANSLHDLDQFTVNRGCWCQLNQDKLNMAPYESEEPSSPNPKMADDRYL